MVDVEPVKFARLVQLSTESWTDARPAALAAHERELMRSIGEGLDAACFHRGPTDPQPGLAGTSGIAAINATGMTGIDPFVRAIGALRCASATATAIFVTPATWEALGLIKEADGSNKPLVAGERAATGAPAETLLGVPVYVSSAICRAMASPSIWPRSSSCSAPTSRWTWTSISASRGAVGYLSAPGEN